MLQIKLLKIYFYQNNMKYKCMNTDIASAIFSKLLAGWAWSQ